MTGAGRGERASRRAARSCGSTLIPAGALSRRRFLGTLGTAASAAAIPACNEAPQEKIIPYVKRPPEVVPGRSQHYATSTTRSGYGVGLLVESHTGRPTKIEGHPEHPASLGKTLVQEQAEILSLYDPDRATSIWEQASIRSWIEFAERFGSAPRRASKRAYNSKGTELLFLEPTGSPLVEWLLDRLAEARPEMKVYFDPSRASVERWNAAREVLGAVVEPQYRFDRAEVIAAFDANFLAAMPMSIRWALEFANYRDIEHPTGRMNRLYAVETVVTVTGATADHRLAVRASEVPQMAAGVLHSLGTHAPDRVPEAVRRLTRPIWESLTDREKKWLGALAADLWENRGRAVFIVGDQQPAVAHAIGMAINEILDAVGQTVVHVPSPILRAGTDAFALDGFLNELDTGTVATAFVLGPNPVYSLPPVFEFERRFAKAAERVTLSLYENETALATTWFLDRTHFLESWGSERAYDGTISIRQPLIRPLYGGHSVEDVLSVLAGLPLVGSRELLHHQFLQKHGNEREFAEAVRRGFLPGTGYVPNMVSASFEVLARMLAALEPAHRYEGLELVAVPDPRIEEGRLSNNAWLLELPEPISKLSWDNAALVAPATALKLQVATEDVIAIEKGGRHIEAPVLVSPGAAPDTIAIWLGWGRQGAESNARGAGVNVNPLREREHRWVTRDIEVRHTGRKVELATTQDEFSMHDRPLALHKTKHEWQKHPDFTKHLNEAPPTILPDRLEGSPQWGMAVDLTRCTGCSTCVIACQAENNIPTVGKQMVAMGREMQWMRIDTYYEGPLDDPKVLLQPMLCQHCEKAPCEYVCPVNATVHSEDGLNEMIYNRCVGTRFCSNNCPYKVRRFNYYEWNDNPPAVKEMVFNPNVTVRARGVMEKCTYCVQRIRRAQIDAKVDKRQDWEQDVQTACQQACPTDAIVFGPVSDPRSRVSHHHHTQRTYGVLSDLGTRPRTRYLARIENENEGLS